MRDEIGTSDKVNLSASVNGRVSSHNARSAYSSVMRGVKKPSGTSILVSNRLSSLASDCSTVMEVMRFRCSSVGATGKPGDDTGSTFSFSSARMT